MLPQRACHNDGILASFGAAVTSETYAADAVRAADQVIAAADAWADERQAAGEEPIPGASRDDLVAGLTRAGHRHAVALNAEDDLEALVRSEAKPGDIVVCLGAGTISAWANALPERLAR